ncbi:MAG: hypothetical protein A2X67_02995 [Ignavibacteria bacterium GWA2_55_11]|nr:MAG: hypothetical protein A2X67_02995 [Ignavibacteria bacterium GWA2_55_11]OGU72878.1 MAG: hypothetical protein A3G43_07050 [Ignavibacteria bacterium RIFCSPLOWO2_12_FULL_56_21]OGU74859.1 MAG: hypothetical protein A3H45_05740 [Ignavibacteria bacterium RIFCSPLOWO2_02_FULL_55_14]
MTRSESSGRSTFTTVCILTAIILGVLFACKRQVPEPEDDTRVPSPSLARDSVIRSILARIQPDSIRATVEVLQGFGSRFALAPSRDSVAVWIEEQFRRRGFDQVVRDSFLLSYAFRGHLTETWQKNVVATFRGSNLPGSTIVIGAHYDSATRPDDPLVTTNAPGADDNASGTAAVLEIARVTKVAGWTPEITVKFVAFAAEEVGYMGSEDYAGKARAAATNVRLAINLDVIAYSGAPSEGDSVGISYYPDFPNVTVVAASIVQKFTVLVPNNIGYLVSDDSRFVAWGYPAVGFIEDFPLSPYHHSREDVVTNCNFEYCAEITRAACAMLVQYSFADNNLP